MTERSPPRWRPTTSSTRSVRFAGSAAVISSSMQDVGLDGQRAGEVDDPERGQRHAARARLDRSRSSRPSSSSQWRNGSIGVSVRRRLDADVQVRDERRLLVDGDEAAAARLGRRVDDALAAADGDRPPSGRTAPVRILTSVLLPAPLAPMSAWTSPGRTASDADLQRHDRAVRLGDAGRLEQEVGGGDGHRLPWGEDAGDAGGAGIPRVSRWLGRSTRPGPCRRRPARGCRWSSRRSGGRAARAGSRPVDLPGLRAVALPASVTLSARTGSSRTVFGWLAVGSVSTVSPLRSLRARSTPAPPTAAVLVTAAPLRPG